MSNCHLNGKFFLEFQDQVLKSKATKESESNFISTKAYNFIKGTFYSHPWMNMEK